MKKQPLHPNLGTILASGKREGSLIKRAMLCRTGQFWGMNGPVTVTREMLEGIANKYKLEKAKPQNDNDLAPILIDHIRVAMGVMGRVLADGMEVAPWKGPDGIMYDGLFADLRVDDEEARQFVESGKFAQLSISFDEESLDFYEVSFVAVPAAQGSIILSKGGKNVDFKKKLQLQLKKNNALAAAVRERTQKRQAILARMSSKQVALEKSARAAEKSLKALQSALSAGQIKTRFESYVRQGKMTPAELAGIDFVELGALPPKALSAVESSYDRRAVSSDVVMHGQTSERVEFSGDLSPKKMREAIELQRKGGGKLSALEAAVVDKEKELGIEPEKEEKPNDKLGEGEAPAAPEKKALGEEDWKKVQEHLADCHAKISAALEHIGGITSDSDKLAEADKDQEKELGSDDDAADMGAEGDDDKSLEDGKDDDKKLGDDESPDKKEGAQ